LIEQFREGIEAVPLVVVLRGLVPDRAASVARLLAEAGVRLMEVTLNSPGALQSIRLARAAVGHHVLVGAGTVLAPQQVEEAVTAGAEFLVMPNLDLAVMEAGRRAGVALMPGVMTPTEAFLAAGQGATVLKLFPAEVVGPAGLKALRAVLPSRVAPVFPVGGVDAQTMKMWVEAGADGFGVGGSLFKPEYGDDEILMRARALVDACLAACARKT
jgi:2-dehydro-3-deoxyphosphogalactonate aldolase